MPKLGRPPKPAGAHSRRITTTLDPKVDDARRRDGRSVNTLLRLALGL